MSTAKKKKVTSADKVTEDMFVSLIFRGKELDPGDITTKLCLQPFYSFKRGDIRKDGSRIWTHGCWMYRTSEEINSEDFLTHINWLVDRIEPVKHQLFEINSNEKIESEISCYWVMPSNHEVLNLSPELLTRLAAIGLSIKFSIYSPYQEKTNLGSAIEPAD